ncbi:MAG: 2-oxoacid:acceptor oxidoreductase subunit alpha [Candidatus Stahlbacteria bacterium]|nr:2-oxoacid:acceptor oxidoreductase subunit alpha [Candidatus Stahlbacteria bacterium]
MKTKRIENSHLLTGNEACAEGALAAGCRFLAGYPIQPSMEIMHRFLAKSPEMKATFVQMEDEISALAAVLGAVWTGKKGMTATSGPGFSLMMEHIGLGVMLETPCVIVNVQRIGPSTGIPNSAGQSDIMQSRWGSHGDYELIALSPSSAQEMFDFTIKAFNLSERYRVPVVILADEYVAHIKEEVVIAEDIKIERRRYYDGPKEKYLPFKRDADFVPQMVDIGQGYKFHVTGLTHDDRGYPIMNEEYQEYNVHPLVWKIRNNAEQIIDLQEKETGDAEIVIISYGATARAASKAMEQARKEGIKVGSLKLNTIWPFPDKRVAELAKQVKAFVVPEMNYGQIVFEVERCSYGNANVVFVPYSEKGVDKIDDLVYAIKQAVKEKVVKKEVIEYKI